MLRFRRIEIENFVVSQIREIGKDSEVVAGTIRQTRMESEKRSRELESERAILEKELARYNSDLRKLVGLVAANPLAADRMADVQERIRVAEQRVTAVREELMALGRELVDEKEAVQALALFDPVWDVLSPREQARVIQLLVERVDYDGAKGTVAITFHPTGIRSLVDEMKRRETA